MFTSKSHYLWVLAVLITVGCVHAPPVATPPSLSLATSTFSPLTPAPLTPGQTTIFRLLREIVVTPDDVYKTGSFARINFVPATNRFIVTFGTKASIEKDNCQGAGYAYKEYTLDMQPAGNNGRFLWYPDVCEAGDSGSVMVDNIYYFVDIPTGPGYPYGWRLLKLDAATMKTLAEVFVPLKSPNEGQTDPAVEFANGQIDIFNQYNQYDPNKIWQEGSALHHHFFSLDLQPQGVKYLSDAPQISGASMIFLDGIYYIVTANSYVGDLFVSRYSRDWKYLGSRHLIHQANWSQGIAFDGRRFYVSYIDTSQRNGNKFFPVFQNVHLAAFDREWNLLGDLAVTHFTPTDNQQPGRPYIILHGGLLYLSYDLDPIDPTTHEEMLQWQAHVNIYELPPGAP